MQMAATPNNPKSQSPLAGLVFSSACFSRIVTAPPGHPGLRQTLPSRLGETEALGSPSHHLPVELQGSGWALTLQPAMRTEATSELHYGL